MVTTDSKCFSYNYTLTEVKGLSIHKQILWEEQTLLRETPADPDPLTL